MQATKAEIVALLKAQNQPVNFRQLFTLATGNRLTPKTHYYYVKFIKGMKRLSREDSRIVIVAPKNKVNGARIFFRPQYGPVQQVMRGPVANPGWNEIVEEFITQTDVTPLSEQNYTRMLIKGYHTLFGNLHPRALTLRSVYDAIVAGKHKMIPTDKSGGLRYYSRGSIYSVLLLLNNCSHFAKNRGLMGLTFDESTEYKRAFTEALDLAQASRGTKGKSATTRTPTPVPSQPQKKSLWQRLKELFVS